jgi:hypothetical protein
LEWLLKSFQESLASLRDGLGECADLLAPKEPGSTLVLSSLRSESVKGFVSRVGTRITKGVSQVSQPPKLLFRRPNANPLVQDIQVRLNSLPPSRGAVGTRLCFSGAPGAPELVIGQLTSLRDLVSQSLDVVDVSTWTGDPLNASFISGQLRLLYENLSEARTLLKGDPESLWWEKSVDENVS